MDNNNKKNQTPLQLNTNQNIKSIQLLEVLNKIQNAINNENVIPQFIQFAKNMDELRKKCQKNENRVKELEILLNRSNNDKITLQRQVNELKVDIEMHNEKRVKAENERDKLVKQIDMFRDILSDKRTHEHLTDEERHNILSQYHYNNDLNNYSTNQRLSINNPIEETGSIISDYTEEDLDRVEDRSHNTPYHARVHTRKSSIGLNSSIKQNNQNQNEEEINDAHTNRIKRRSSQTRQENRKSTSLTRQAQNREAPNSKHIRTRSQENNNQQQQQQQHHSTPGTITAITTLKVSENGGPITLTSEIKQHLKEDEYHMNTRSTNNAKNKLEISLTRPKTSKKKRPSREFLQKSADEIDTSDSEAFWLNEQQQQQNQHLLEPIVEVCTPQVLSKTSLKQQQSQSSAQKAQQTLGNTAQASADHLRKYKRPHLFKNHVTINSETCGTCDKRTKFGKVVLKCRDCELVCHTECKDALSRPCYPPVRFPSIGTISDYAPYESPRIPPILQHLIAEIESRGICNEVGLYRVNGSDMQVKQLRERLIKRNLMPDLKKINDINTLCSFVKDFLMNLSEHLIPYNSWSKFARACEIHEEREKAFQQLIEQLPEANRDTLSFVCLHLQRISQVPECKMPISNLSKVFGPSIVGNSTPNLVPAEIINEIKIQQSIVEQLLKLPSDFYAKFVDNNSDNFKLFKNQPPTPELLRKSRTATVLSSVLGPAMNNVKTPSNTNKQTTKYTSRTPASTNSK